MDPYVWTVCTDLQERGHIPSIESLKSVDSTTDSSIEVVLIDRRSDTNLKELQNRVLSISCSCITTEEVIDQLAKLVCNRMGWVCWSHILSTFFQKNSSYHTFVTKILYCCYKGFSLHRRKWFFFHMEKVHWWFKGLLGICCHSNRQPICWPLQTSCYIV